MESPLYTCKENEVSDGFVEARIEDVTTGITVEVGQYGLAQRWVMIRGFKPPSIAPAKGTFSTSSDFLADLLVRGIRSLEEEREQNLASGCKEDRRRSGGS